MNSAASFCYVRKNVEELSPEEMESMQLDLLEKLAIICSHLKLDDQHWSNIKIGPKSYDFLIKAIK